MITMPVAIGCGIVAGGFRLRNLHHFWDTERVARPWRLMSEGSLTGRLSLWRGSWMVALVSP